MVTDTKDYFYQSIGFALELLAKSEYHKQYPIGNYFTFEVLPALNHQQAKLYANEQGSPVGMVTWALLSAEVEEEVLKTGRRLSFDEWQSGDRLFFVDWISPYGNTRKIFRDMYNIFGKKCATASSIKRNADGGIKRICCWKSIDFKKNIC